jgi:hypothetical protein
MNRPPFTTQWRVFQDFTKWPLLRIEPDQRTDWASSSSREGEEDASKENASSAGDPSDASVGRESEEVKVVMRNMVGGLSGGGRRGGAR